MCGKIVNQSSKSFLKQTFTSGTARFWAVCYLEMRSSPEVSSSSLVQPLLAKHENWDPSQCFWNSSNVSHVCSGRLVPWILVSQKPKVIQVQNPDFAPALFGRTSRVQSSSKGEAHRSSSLTIPMSTLRFETQCGCNGLC